MDRTAWAKRFEEWINRFITLWSFLPATFAASAVGLFGINGDYPPFLFLSFTLFAFSGTLIAIGISHTNSEAHWRAGGVVLVVLLGIAYSLYVQSRLERRLEAARIVAYNTYVLDNDGLASDIAFLEGSQGKKIVEAEIAVTFNNNNPFGIWVNSTRRLTALAGRVSSDEQESYVRFIPPYAKDVRFSDFPIKFYPPLDVSKGLIGNIDFIICYGRDRRRMDKGFIQKGSIRFKARADGGLYAPDFRQADEGVDTHGLIDRCPTQSIG